MKYSILLIGILFFGTMSGQGSVSVTTSSTIDQMMNNFISKNRSQETVKGWRIQIIVTDDRRKMETARRKFISMYPNIDVNWKHLAPYYRVKVGAYENKMQLMGFLLELKREFPGVIPVMDSINKLELVRN